MPDLPEANRVTHRAGDSSRRQALTRKHAHEVGQLLQSFVAGFLRQQSMGNKLYLHVVFVVAAVWMLAACNVSSSRWSFIRLWACNTLLETGNMLAPHPPSSQPGPAVASCTDPRVNSAATSASLQMQAS